MKVIILAASLLALACGDTTPLKSVKVGKGDNFVSFGTPNLARRGKSAIIIKPSQIGAQSFTSFNGRESTNFHHRPAVISLPSASVFRPAQLIHKQIPVHQSIVTPIVGHQAPIVVHHEGRPTAVVTQARPVQIRHREPASVVAVPAVTSGTLIQANGFKEIRQEPQVPYAFEYAVNDDFTNAAFTVAETSSGKGVEGSYTVALPDGRTQHVSYTVSGDNGYVAQVSYEGEAQYPTQEHLESTHSSPSVKIL